MDYLLLLGGSLAVITAFTGTIARWVRDDMNRTIKVFPEPDKTDDLEATYRRLTAAAEKRERALYLAAPSAFWLAPDGPLSVPVPAPKPVFVPPAPHPPCPNRCNAHVLIMGQHGGEATMWSCTLCGTDFTRKGKARKINSKIARARQMRELRHQVMLIERGLASPPAIYEPRQVYRIRMRDEEYDIDSAFDFDV